MALANCAKLPGAVAAGGYCSTAAGATSRSVAENFRWCDMLANERNGRNAEVAPEKQGGTDEDFADNSLRARATARAQNLRRVVSALRRLGRASA